MTYTNHPEVRCLVLTGYGVNCEREMALAAEKAGATSQTLHLEALLKDPSHLDHTDLLLFPGGFSFGDELGAAKVYANKMAFTENGGASLKSLLQRFVAEGKAIMGICNGFQLLVKLGLLPSSSAGQQVVSLTHNNSGRFEDRWIQHKVNPTNCIFTQGLEHLYLPVRHGEGRFVTDRESENRLFEQQQVVLQYTDAEGEVAETYPANPNGSRHGIAGICDETGRVFGMMAHPEAFIQPYHHPSWTRMGGQLPVCQGLQLFERGVTYLKEKKLVTQ